MESWGLIPGPEADIRVRTTSMEISIFYYAHLHHMLEKNMQTDVHPFVSIGEFFLSSMSCFVFVPCAFLGGHLVCGVLSRNVVQWVPDKHPLWYCCM